MDLPWEEHRVEDKLKALSEVERVVKKYLGPDTFNSKPLNPKSIPEYEAYNESVRARLNEMNLCPDRPLFEFIKGLIEYVDSLEQIISRGSQRNKHLYELIDQQKEEITKLRSKDER